MNKPTLSKMSMAELRLYFRALRHMETVITGTQTHPLACGVTSEISGWADDGYAWVDRAMSELCAHLEKMSCGGAAERFRVCMLAEHAAWLADDPKEIVRIVEGGRRHHDHAA